MGLLPNEASDDGDVVVLSTTYRVEVLTEWGWEALATFGPSDKTHAIEHYKWVCTASKQAGLRERYRLMVLVLGGDVEVYDVVTYEEVVHEHE